MLKKKHIPVVFLDPAYFHGSFQDSFSDYGSSEFNFKMRMKLELVKHVLENGFNVLYADCDVTIFKNPFPFFKKYPGYSIVAQQDETICAGFMYLRPFRNTLDFLNLVSQKLLTTDAHDQDIIVSLLPMFPLKYALLPQNRFPSGGVFFDQYQYYWDRREDELYIFHNTYVIGKRNKELRMREMHLYVVDVDGEYSDPTRKYLTFEVADNSNLEAVLMKMVQMANVLNRTLVLPPTRCADFTARWVWCNMCSMQPLQCYRSVLDLANNGYRESVFFTNAKVPKDLKYEDAHNAIHRFDSRCNPAYAYRSTFPAHRQHRNPTVCHACRGSTSYCETRFGYRQKERVLKFYSVWRVCEQTDEAKYSFRRRSMFSFMEMFSKIVCSAMSMDRDTSFSWFSGSAKNALNCWYSASVSSTEPPASTK